MISDIHFGVRNNSIEWLEIHKDYFHNFFIPLLKENKKDGDALFILGDIFESRQTINILILNEALKIFTEIAKILPVYIIVGNHDSYRKLTTDINSTIIFKNINNITVFDKVEIVKVFNNQEILIMPWQEGHDKEIEIITNNNTDYLFCHTDFKGMKFNKKVEVHEGLDISSLSKFKKVYSGHIHLSQNKKNVFMIGCIMSLTRSDIGDKKNVVLLDFETDKETIFKNNYSPKFMKFKVDGLLNLTVEDFENEIQNNFIDILVDNNWVTSFPFTKLSDAVVGYRKMNYVLSTLSKDYDDVDDDLIDDNMGIEELTEFYIDTLTYSDDFKKRLIEATSKLYKKAEKLLSEKTMELD